MGVSRSGRVSGTTKAKLKTFPRPSTFALANNYSRPVWSDDMRPCNKQIKVPEGIVIPPARKASFIVSCNRKYGHDGACSTTEHVATTTPKPKFWLRVIKPALYAGAYVIVAYRLVVKGDIGSRG